MSKTWRIFLLWLFTAGFLSRVQGQIMVGIYTPPWLPEWKEWYSGLLPYPWLVLSQLLLLMFMAVVNSDQTREGSQFQVTSDKTRGRLRLFAHLYVLAMVVRYVNRMIFVPEARWFGGTLPIWFHFGLAAWIYTIATESRKRT